MNDNLYIVDFPRKTAEYAEAYSVNKNLDFDRCARCPQCGNIVSSAYWASPREMVLTKRKVPDFLYGFFGHVCFVLSERALQVLRDAKITGITCAEEIEHVRFQRKSKKEDVIPKYYFVDLERSRLTLNHKKSVIHYGKLGTRPTCSLCRQVPATYDFTRHLVFNMDEYEGYDIFFTYELGGLVFVSQRFVDVWNKNNLTNLHVTIAERHDQWVAAYFLDGDEDA